MNQTRIHDDGNMEELLSWAGETAKKFPWFALPKLLQDTQINEFSSAAVFVPDRKVQYERLFQQKLGEQIRAIDSKIETDLSNEPITPINQPDNTAANDKTNAIDSAKMLRELERQMRAEAVQATLIRESDTLTDGLQTENITEKNQGTETLPASSESIHTTRSFGDWLRAIENLPKDIGKPKKPKSQPEIIERFLKEASKPERPSTFIPIQRPKATFFSPEKMVEESLKESEDFITETLAAIYIKQGNQKKAIRAYEILLQKHPEKSTYFAGLINELKKK